MREILLFFDRPAEQVIAAAAAFLAQRGVRVAHRTAYSVAFVAASGSGTGGGQFAAVPVQLKPEWCRVWVSVEDHDAAGANDVQAAPHSRPS